MITRHHPMRRLRRLAAGLTVLPVGLVATGCGTTLGDLPLPGSSVSGDTIQVTAEFKDALNLAQGGEVRINGVTSGKVQEVTTEDFQAEVEMTLREDAKIREGATARLRYQTPLGELFVDVTNPPQGALLADGARLSTKVTETAPAVEDALSQASLLINGGGLGGLQTVTEELNTIFNGREGNVKSLLRNASTFMTEANATTNDIDVALRSLDSVSQTLDARKQTIRRALREIEPASKVLRKNTPAFTKLLAEVEKFSRVANQTVNLTRSQLLRVFRQAGPVLAEFANLGDRYAVSLGSLARLGRTADNIIPNDYLALSIVLHLELDALEGTDLSALNDLLGGVLDLGLLDGLSGLDTGGLPLRNQPRGNNDSGSDLGLGLLGQGTDKKKSGSGGGALDLIGGLL